MKNTTVITIGREYGSGGREIGEKLAERLEIPYYDKKILERLAKADKNRAQFYNYYTNQKWGDAKNYDLCVNSSVLGVDGTVNVLQNFIGQKKQGM